MNEKDIKHYLFETGKKPNIENLKKLLHNIEKACKKAIIMSGDGVIITTMNKKK